MKIVCSSNMPFAKEAFSTLGDVEILDGRAISAGDVRDADALAVRSTTQVNRELLHGSAVRFVGTATIGTDHFDIDYLDSAGIRWCSAPGCNANSVSEYLTAALLCLAERHRFTLEGKTVGVIGVGNVGRRVVNKAEALGLRVLRNDPPRERAEGGDGFVALDALLPQADIVTLHVPLTRSGIDATVHLAGRGFFERLKPGALFFNCSRGAVTDTDALLAALAAGRVSRAVIDTWEGEPRYRPDLLARADIATPHIAGHSFEGKYIGTVMVYEQLCRFLGAEPAWSPDPLLPPPPVPRVEVRDAHRPEQAVLWDVVRRVYDIEADDRRMRESCVADAAARAAAFDRMRKQYPMRREFRFTEVAAPPEARKLCRRLAGLGFATGSIDDG